MTAMLGLPATGSGYLRAASGTAAGLLRLLRWLGIARSRLVRHGLVRRRSRSGGRRLALAGRPVTGAAHLLVLRSRRARAVAAVGPVEAGPLEHNADGRVHLAQRPTAFLARGQRVVGELLDGLQPLVTDGARVLVRRHWFLLARRWHSWPPTARC